MIRIVQKTLPYDFRSRRPLPGIAPLDPAEWLLFDEAYNEQMALRDALLATRRDDVVAMAPEAHPAAEELLDQVLDFLRGHPTFSVHSDHVIRPDGTKVTIDLDDPMVTLGRLVQEDLCVMQKQGDEHVLTAAVLCFPSNWTLRQKFLKPMTGIHVPVAPYDENIAKRVQRLLDGIQAERPLWRFNVLWYHEPTLFNPRLEGEHEPVSEEKDAAYLRSERQVLMRLPESRAVVFSIHTYMIPGAVARAW
ncbi:hypothetical protein TG4357_00767 [Thalassovita gelatinovora]|uniref:DUF3445 domain-containing protein n=1 Tax=Thalassovita gelatinovora TaxID=53501 RepID=A0A0P1F6L3_THAGE|nr:DUF3445 domain-containing protein [Thalassovita gelatinovora]QIZ79144.1 DUF3445 domain-containing protein [Thalassovita gelatinovora]CUH63584.1 hypothetical protein TG4357_00767 [Thalassovita gelatinovora]SER00099.1 Protein of unknown function [Thalassovita gelatinovora]